MNGDSKHKDIREALSINITRQFTIKHAYFTLILHIFVLLKLEQL